MPETHEPARMRPLTQLIDHAKAIERILEACPPVRDVQRIPLTQANGRTLAEPIVAANDVPMFDRAAMDGYAFRHADAAAGTTRLKPVGRVHAGEPNPSTIEPGLCMAIATGAPLPPGADTVVPVEKTREDDGFVVLTAPVGARQHVSPRGADMRAGDNVLRPGSVLNPARIAVIAALGLDHVHVLRRPVVAVFSTGTELRALGTALGPGDIHDSNGPALAALLEEVGAEVDRGGIVPDETDVLRAEIKRHAATADLVVLSGGSSAGERDVVRDAVAAEGEVLFHGVRVKPGKPLLLGRVGGKPVIGLPGYPVSCISDAYLFVRPGLQRLMGRPPEGARRVHARMAVRVESVKDRLWFVPVRLDGPLAWPTYKESGSTTSLADAVGYVAVDPDTDGLLEGDPVEVVLF